MFWIKFPEIYLKEEIVRFLNEEKSERIVEIPNILASVPVTKSKILDIGCRYSLIPIQLASLGHKVWGIDIHQFRKKHRNFKFIQDDFLTRPFKKNFFDLVISLSSIEHFGLGFYGDKLDEKADIKAVSKVAEILKPDGIFLMTAPFGKPVDSDWYRVYDLSRIRKLLSAFKVERLLVYKRDGLEWVPSSARLLEKIDSSNQVLGVFFVQARKK